MNPDDEVDVFIRRDEFDEPTDERTMSAAAADHWDTRTWREHP